MHNMVSAHFSGHHQTCIPQPMKEIIQIIQLQIFFFYVLVNIWMCV